MLSSNSSKPPSSDGLSKLLRTNSLRQKGKNKSGGQLGHKGETLKQTQAPDKIERHKLMACPRCASSLISTESFGILKRQVFDIPLPYDKIIKEGVLFHESLPAFAEKKGRGRKARRSGHNLILRLKNYCDDVLRFLFNPLVPFTNNQAERDLRMMKCKQKISGGFRSAKGAEIFARIRAFISTARKQGWSIFDSIQQVVRGFTPMPA